jgi:hypothetical protein
MTSEEKLHELALDIYILANYGKCRPDILPAEKALILERIKAKLFGIETAGWREGFFHALKAIAGNNAGQKE